MSLDGAPRCMKKDNHNVGFFPAAQSANVHANLARMHQGARMGGDMNFGRGQAVGLQGMGQGHQGIMSSGGGPSRSSGGLPSLFDISGRNQPSLSAQKRIDADRASNILATFGLSSRDLDELSRYPEDKLTPESLPDILMQLKRKRTDDGAPFNYSRGDSSPREDRSFRASRSEWEEERRFRNNFEGRNADPVVNYDHGFTRESSFRYFDRKDYEPERLRGDDFRRDDMRLSGPMYKYDSDYGKMGPSSRGQERSLLERKRGSPSLSNVNDYHGFLPAMLPHLCSLCDVTVHSMKEWNHHRNEPAHKRRCLLLLEIYPQWVPEDLPSTRNDSSARQSNIAPDAASAILAAIRHLDALDPHGGNRKGQIQDKRNMAMDEPGRVLHMTELPKGKCKVKDILKLAQPFGIITKYLLLNTKSEGFVEMATSGQAQTAVAFYSMKPAILYGKKVRVDMSHKYKEIDLKQKQEKSGGRVALLQNLPPSGYSDADVVKVGASFGKVLNYIVMRLRNQAFLEMESKKCMVDMVKHFRKTPLIFRGTKVTVNASQKYKTLVLKKPSVKVQELLKEQDEADRKRRRSSSPSSKKKVPSKSKNPPKADGDKEEQGPSESSPSKDIKENAEGDDELEIDSEGKEVLQEEAITVVESEAELDEEGVVEGLCTSESEDETEQGLLKETVYKTEASDTVEQDSKTNVETNMENTPETTETAPAIQRSKINQPIPSQELKEEFFPENIDEFVTVDEVGDVEAGSLDLEDLTTCADNNSKLETDEAKVSIVTEKSEETNDQKEEDVDKPKRKRGRKRGKNIKAKRVEQSDKKESGEENEIKQDGNEVIENKMDADQKDEMQDETSSTCIEPESKRARLRSPTPDEYKLGPYQSNNPIGLDYVVPKAGFYCKLCCLFYTKEEVAKKTHCGSLPHYQKLKKMLDKKAEDYRKAKKEQSPEVQMEEQSDQ